MIQKSKTILNEATIKYYSIISALNIKILNRGDFRHTDMGLLCFGTYYVWVHMGFYGIIWDLYEMTVIYYRS